jgi:hypothetical protein
MTIGQVDAPTSQSVDVSRPTLPPCDPRRRKSIGPGPTDQLSSPQRSTARRLVTGDDRPPSADCLNLLTNER